MEDYLKRTMIVLCILAIAGCIPHNIKKEIIAKMPEKIYAKIIILENSDPGSIEPLMGAIFVEDGGNVNTDFPLKRTIKSLNELSWIEKQSLPYLETMVVKDTQGKVQGYLKMYRGMDAFFWEEKDGSVLVQVEKPKSASFFGGEGGARNLTSSGGH